MKIYNSSISGSFTIYILVCLLNACNSDEVGQGKDTIKLSEKEVQLPANQSSYLINTQGTFWWITELYLDENRIDFGNIDTSRSEFIIENTEFSIERINSTEIHIQMTSNVSGVQRELRIYLQAGNYGDRIVISQLGQ